MTENTIGQCHCGSVKFEGKGPIKSVDACRCATYRQLNVGPYMGVGFHEGLTVTDGASSLKWYDSSDWVRRGFCSECGSSLFYNLKGTEFYSASSRCVDMTGGMAISHEYFIDEKSDFYDFARDRARLTAAEVFASFQKGDNND